MTSAVPDILARIAGQKRLEIAAKASQEARWRDRAEARRGDRRDFRAALLRKSPAIIAEIKKASPSKGVLSEDFNPEQQAKQYEAGGAAALSVLTDQQFFQGSLMDLALARESVALPVLRKDFTLADVDVVEAAAHGADAILLIAALLTRDQMERLRKLASLYGMESLVEVHDAAELDRALEAGARIIGVNNRDLRTFEVTLETSIKLAARIPRHVLKVSESGIQAPQDVGYLKAAGFQAFLVGEHLMKSGDPAAALRVLAG
jgi:indole-3-glycerol phosphate synthase